MALALLGVNLAFAISSVRSTFTEGSLRFASVPQQSTLAPVQLDLAFETVTPPRKVWPYSVIPGGVQNGVELRDALLRDPIAAEHYAGFRAKAAHIIELAHDRQAYVSYRLGNRIYWTAHQITLHAGETLLSDGTNLVRTRCGNRISAVPGPIHPAEPSEKVMNVPIAPRIPEITNEPLAGDPLWEGGTVRLAVLSTPSIGGSGGTVPVSPVTPLSPFVPTTPSGCCSVIFGGGKPSVPPSRTPPSAGPPIAPPPIIPPPVVPPVAASEPATWQLLLVSLAAIVLLLKSRRA